MRWRAVDWTWTPWLIRSWMRTQDSLYRCWHSWANSCSWAFLIWLQIAEHRSYFFFIIDLIGLQAPHFCRRLISLVKDWRLVVKTSIWEACWRKSCRLACNSSTKVSIVDEDSLETSGIVLRTGCTLIPLMLAILGECSTALFSTCYWRKWGSRRRRSEEGNEGTDRGTKNNKES